MVSTIERFHCSVLSRWAGANDDVVPLPPCAEQAEQNYIYMASRGGDDQEPVYGYSVRTPVRLRATSRSFRQPSRVGYAQRRLSSDNTSLLLSTRPTSGYSELSEASMATSLTPGVPQQPKASTRDISKPILQAATEHVYEDISALNKALVSVP